MWIARTGILAGSNTVVPSDFELIETQTVGSGGVATLTFSSIPQTYRHLQIRGIARERDGGNSILDIGVRVNGDTSTSNYVLYHLLYGSGSTAASAAYTTGFGFMKLGTVTGSAAPANTFGTFVIDLLDYRNTSKFKVFRSLAGNDQNNTSGSVTFQSGMWMSSAAVTSLTINNSNGFGTGLAQYSTISLYGVK